MSKFKVGDPVTWNIGNEGLEAVVTTVAPTNYHRGYDYEVMVIETEPDEERQSIMALGKILLGDRYDGSEAANENELMAR